MPHIKEIALVPTENHNIDLRNLRSCWNSSILLTQKYLLLMFQESTRNLKIRKKSKNGQYHKMFLKKENRE